MAFKWTLLIWHVTTILSYFFQFLTFMWCYINVRIIGYHTYFKERYCIFVKVSQFWGNYSPIFDLDHKQSQIFRKGAWNCVPDLCDHVLATCPLNSLIARCVYYLFPPFVTESPEACGAMLDKLLMNMF